jgi:polar amino acid transport system permease protein
MPRKARPLVDVLQFLLLAGVIAWVLAEGFGNIHYNWQWYRIPETLFRFQNGRFVPGPLLNGLWVTVQISTASFILAFAFGLITALLRLSGAVTAQWVARGYLEIVRNTPLLVQLFFIYFVLSPILGIERYTAAVLALSLFEGAYASEIFRAGIQSIARDQWEAADSLGLTRYQAYRFVILPQAIHKILPPLTGQGISLIKDSALVSTIAIYDLTMQGQAIIAETFLTFEIWFTVAAMYLALTLSLSVMVQRMESRFEAVA